VVTRIPRAGIFLPRWVRGQHQPFRHIKTHPSNDALFLSILPHAPVTMSQTQRLAALAIGCSLLMYAVHMGFYFAGDLSYMKGRSWESIKHLLRLESSSQDFQAHSSSSSVSPACLAYPFQESGAVIVVKTGATEALARIPTLLLTFLSCAEDDVLFFSDMEQKIGGVHIHDALVDVVNEAKTVNTDFELYELQKQLYAHGEDISSLSKAKEAWALDKYKNIHIAQKTWELRPNKTWYFFIDADTYVVWPNFFAWLKRLDPTKHLYLGRTIHTLNLFAHGGPGYLISYEAMRRLVGEDAHKIASDFDISASTTCCGDAELAGSLSHKDVSLIDAYPLINHQKPREIPFGQSYWCQPIITMHHLSPEEVNNLWQFEQSRANPKASSPLQYSLLSS
jgi:hypothetical protein